MQQRKANNTHAISLRSTLLLRLDKLFLPVLLLASPATVGVLNATTISEQEDVGVSTTSSTTRSTTINCTF